MNCDNNYCIYADDGKCILDSISIDALGMCSECIFAEFDEEILKKAKRKMLDRL